MSSFVTLGYFYWKNSFICLTAWVLVGIVKEKGERMSKKQLKKEIEFYKKLAEESKDKMIKTCDNLSQMYGEQMDLMDEEIKRLKVVIEYLEEKN